MIRLLESPYKSSLRLWLKLCNGCWSCFYPDLCRYFAVHSHLASDLLREHCCRLYARYLECLITKHEWFTKPDSEVWMKCKGKEGEKKNVALHKITKITSHTLLHFREWWSNQRLFASFVMHLKLCEAIQRSNAAAWETQARGLDVKRSDLSNEILPANILNFVLTMKIFLMNEKLLNVLSRLQSMPMWYLPTLVCKSLWVEKILLVSITNDLDPYFWNSK